MFYNVENLFDTLDDAKTEDSEFTPQSDKHWNSQHYWQKINHIAKVIIAVGGWKPPSVIGLAEIENARVLDDLTKKSPLARFNYKIVHQESPDPRGIDVALLYRPDQFSLVEKAFFPVLLHNDQTRDILLASLQINDDTVHVLVNHWPSRWSGELRTESLRITAAQCLRSHIDSLLTIGTSANILVMGDFNDTPKNRSLHDILSASLIGENADSSKLYNLAPEDEDGRIGTIFHRDIIDRWQIFDQVIISKSLLDGKQLRITTPVFQIFRPAWLLDKDGQAPYRSYMGPFYTGGFSDHLPVYIDIAAVGDLNK